MCFKCYSYQPTVPMPEPPPEVKTYRGLAEFQSLYADTVIVAIDLEGIDHRNGFHANGLEIWEKVSEVGASFFDPRDVRLDSGSTSATTCSPKQSPLNTSTERLSSIAKYIITYHAIINRWRQWTEETCDAPHHKTHDKVHTAKPHHCMVTESCFRTHDEAISDLDRLLRDLSMRNLTAEEIETGKRRMVRIICWDARMESNWFHDMDVDVGWYGAIAWDFQQFKPFRSRNEKARTGAEKAFDSLGALGTGAGGMAVIHNAANDTFTQLVAFLRFMLMTEDEWKEWRGRSDLYPGVLNPIDLSWINDQIWKSNQELRPILQPGEKPKEIKDPEPVIMHQSAMAEIKAGVTSTTAGSAPETSSWADALRKPAERISNPSPPWSPTFSWPSTTWTSSSWDWKSTTPWSSLSNLPESVEDHHSGLPAKMSKPVLISPAAASTSTPSTTKTEESGWTLVAHSRGQTKKTVSWQSTRSPPLDTKRSKSDHRGNKHATRPIGSSKPNRQLVNASLNSEYRATCRHCQTANHQ